MPRSIDPKDEDLLPRTELHRHGLRSGLIFGAALLVSAVLISFLFNMKGAPPSTERYFAVGDFPAGHVWFNTAQPISLYTELQGHVVVVLFCDFVMLSDVAALERLQSLRDSMHTDPIFFVVAYVPADSSLEVWRETVRNWWIDVPVIVDNEGAVRQNFAVDSIPQMLLLDTHARVVSRYSHNWQSVDAEGLIRDLLAQGGASRSLANVPFRPDSGEYVPPGYAGPR